MKVTDQQYAAMVAHFATALLPTRFNDKNAVWGPEAQNIFNIAEVLADEWKMRMETKYLPDPPVKERERYNG
jgi:hypothetical protein